MGKGEDKRLEGFTVAMYGNVVVVGAMVFEVAHDPTN